MLCRDSKGESDPVFHTQSSLPLRRVAVLAIAFVSACYAVLYGWQFVDYLRNHESWRFVQYAIDRRGGWGEPVLPLAISSALVTLIGVVVSTAHLTINVRFNLILSIPIVSYMAALACHAPYEAFLAIHVLHGFFVVAILSWQPLLRSLPLIFETEAAQRPLVSWRFSRPALFTSVLLIIFCVASISSHAVWQAFADHTQVGGSAKGPVFRGKFNLWPVLLANAHATLGVLCIWACRSFDRWTILRTTLLVTATVMIPPPVVWAFQGWKQLWPVMHSYDPGAFVGMLPGYFAWFSLSSLLAGIFIMVAGKCGLLDNKRHHKPLHGNYAPPAIYNSKQSGTIS